MSAHELATGRGHTVTKTIVATPLKLTPARRVKFNRGSANEACIAAVRRSLAIGGIVEVHPTYNGWTVHDAGAYATTGTHGYYLADGELLLSIEVPRPWLK